MRDNVAAGTAPLNWRRDILEPYGRFKDGQLTDTEVLRRIDRLSKFWQEPVSPEWLRGLDDHRWVANRAPIRRRRNVSKLAGEFVVEADILGDRFATIACLGGSLIDGLDAFPLAVGNTVEADMLLLMAHSNGELRLLPTEVKTTNETAWYAVVENLIQLKLFQANAPAQEIFHRRAPQGLLDRIRITGLVLAPDEYYRTGIRKAAVAPARQLIAALGVDIRLAVWDATNSTISELTES